jgi:hypothetical protein
MSLLRHILRLYTDYAIDINLDTYLKHTKTYSESPKHTMQEHIKPRNMTKTPTFLSLKPQNKT